MLTRAQIDFYNTNGFLAVEGVYSPQEMKEARAVVEEFVERSRGVTDHTDVYDLEPGHSTAAPRVRRINHRICTIRPRTGSSVTNGCWTWWRRSSARGFGCTATS